MERRVVLARPPEWGIESTVEFDWPLIKPRANPLQGLDQEVLPPRGIPFGSKLRNVRIKDPLDCRDVRG